MFIIITVNPKTISFKSFFLKSASPPACRQAGNPSPRREGLIHCMSLIYPQPPPLSWERGTGGGEALFGEEGGKGDEVD
jgi:hypothetical protein